MTAARPRISLQQARGFMLARQGLHRPSMYPEELVHNLIAIQAQYIRNVPIAFWSRSTAVDLDWVSRALNEEHSLVKTWCMRMTVHVLLSQELPLIVAALGGDLRHFHSNSMARSKGVSRQQLKALEGKVLKALANGPLEREQIHERVPELQAIPGSGWGHDVKSLAFRGDVVFAGDGGSIFARRDQWLPDVEWSLPATEQAQDQLLRRYLAVYGPARLQDFPYWAGNYVPWSRAIFGRLERELVRVELEDHGDDYYLLASDLDTLQAPPDPPALALAPKFDPLLLGHRQSHRFVPPQHFKQVARGAGQLEAIVLVNGLVRATWRLKEMKDRLVLTIDPIEPFTQQQQGLLQDRADDLAAFYGRQTAEVNWLSPS